jgi:hypothetical protein
MPRLWTVALALAACGKYTPDRTGPDGHDPGIDASTHQNPHDGGTLDDGGMPTDDGGAPDGPSQLTRCQEAELHSDFAWLQANVFTPSCATSGCHTGANAEVGLRLEVGQAYNNLVNKGSSTQTGWVRVVPGSLASSYLVVSFGRTAGPPPRDGFMPLGADPLCSEIHEAVERWILAGAPNN